MAQRYQELQMNDFEDEPGLRIVLVGKTGTGKSAVGNTILGRTAFESKLSSSSVTSRSEKKRGEFEGDRLAVVDTPGLYDTILDDKTVKEEIARCISLLAPGPHVILIVLQPTRFTKQEQEIMKMIELMFGEKAGCYSMALFTHGDVLEEEGITIEELIGQNEALQRFIHKCEGNYHVFNNKDQDPRQVRELLEKINKMVKRNGGGCYTNKLFQEAKKAINEEMKRLIKENPNMTVEEARKRAENDNSFIWAVLIGSVAGAGVGAGVGAAIGGLGLGVGAAPGAAVGAAVGAVVGAVGAAASVAVKKKACVIQ